MLLSDDEIDAIAKKCFVQYMNDENDAYDLAFARAIEAAILAKLGAMELPEPESFEAWNAKQHGDPEEIGLLQALRIAYCSGQDSVNVRQAYAHGAAAQLAEKPSGYLRKWAFDGETPVKERKENGRMAWPDRFKLLPVTEIKLMQDDLPLYTRSEAK